MSEQDLTRVSVYAREQAASAPRPSPPTDAERDAYFTRYLAPMTALAILGSVGVTYSATRFALSTGMFVFLGVIGLAVFSMAISLGVNAFTKDFSVAQHRRYVEGWIPDYLPSVDVFPPTCGEPLAVLRNTWQHVSALSWPGALKVYVLDDGGDPEARAMAEGSGLST
jgi:cellulose synthase/poly-beta-1,6-N-acetylglucosamine synthase-like glycosyltransferase